MKETEVVIIGGGVIGTAIARELANYNVDVVLVEKDADLASGTSKANSGIIHAGYNADPTKLKGRLNVRSNKLFDQLTKELNVPFKRIGSLVVAKAEEEIEVLKELKKRGEENGLKDLKIVQGSQLVDLEPNLNEEIIAALYAPTAGIICPYELTIAQGENAAKNGVEVLLETEVTDIEVKYNHKLIKTNQGEIKTDYVINAAGVYADKVARMVGIDDFEITPRRGEYYLFDKEKGSEVNHVIFQVPTEVSKGILVTPTVDDNLLIGPNAEVIDDKDNVATTRKGLDEVINGAKRTLPELSLRGLVTEFTGLRAAEVKSGDFIIEAAKEVKDFINVAGIQSPGLSCAPAIGEMVAEILQEEGLHLVTKETFEPYREEPVRFRELTYEERAELVEKDNNYGQIICRCETVTEGEIVDAIHRPVPATTIGAIKRRTRAGMGRCQGGFCSPRVAEIISRELDIPMTEITKEGKGFEILVEPAKESLQAEVSDNE
ncbi:NAD(P)/FAD-dependent oxidoreductase [Selenihalanaerobacter shriftii]|uniref:Glycerol-3-phosphate dehydrogenase n=1 Tax=Selenihalanaerobacter shriftii TaxID=142842 RepID=A0A1T4P6C5_9FIRM|nr:NAD(P)/FAD-dependent oxidoreductase [Selenihalanaerobacter shriftii]SJZ86999.1 glycerol-3-phosphate dehydrogenase [Selenihalanaerobacter shriftii]